MPRFIDSDIGSRQLRIDDIADNFGVGADQLPNGDGALANNPTPDSNCRAYDVGTTVGAYAPVIGQDWSMLFWYKGSWGGGNHQSVLCTQVRNVVASIPITSTVGWYIGASGNSVRFTLFADDGMGGLFNQSVDLGNGSDTGSFRFYGVTFDADAGTNGTLYGYVNGVQSDSQVLIHPLRTIDDDYLFTYVQQANLALDTFQPQPLASNWSGQIAKLAFFQSFITEQQMADLNIAMNS